MITTTKQYSENDNDNYCEMFSSCSIVWLTVSLTVTSTWYWGCVTYTCTTTTLPVYIPVVYIHQHYIIITVSLTVTSTWYWGCVIHLDTTITNNQPLYFSYLLTPNTSGYTLCLQNNHLLSVPEWHGVVHDSHAEMGCDRLWKTTLYIQWGNLDVIIIVTVPVSVAAAKIPRVLC